MIIETGILIWIYFAISNVRRKRFSEKPKPLNKNNSWNLSWWFIHVDIWIRVKFQIEIKEVIKSAFLLLFVFWLWRSNWKSPTFPISYMHKLGIYDQWYDWFILPGYPISLFHQLIIYDIFSVRGLKPGMKKWKLK